MANTSAIRQQAAPTTYHLLAAQQEPYKKMQSHVQKCVKKNMVHVVKLHLQKQTKTLVCTCVCVCMCVYIYIDISNLMSYTLVTL